jgi:Ni/Fe-hydrogenase 1 B-type cytochrome subunit
MSEKSESGEPKFPAYVWEAPVRLWHWLMATCMVVLIVTGYFIGSPLPSVPGEASDNFLLGYIRFAHFAAAYVFAVILLGWAREIFVVPWSMLQPAFWKGVITHVRYYLFIENNPPAYVGHNPLAALAMFWMFVVGSVFMIVTGFALYGEGAGMESWQYRLFSSWVIPLFGQSQDVHTWHHLGMWYQVLFILVHVYTLFREDFYSRETVVSTMLSGFRYSKR